jgi:hypothetical protein
MHTKIKREKTFTVIWDSGASQSITNDKRDFVGPIKSVPLGSKLSRMAQGLNIAGMGNWYGVFRMSMALSDISRFLPSMPQMPSCGS